MCYCEYHCNRRHRSLVLKTQSETCSKQGFLLVQQKSRQLCVALESLRILQLLHLWNEASVFIVVFSHAWSSSLLFFISPLISSLWRAGAFGSVVVCSLPLLTVWVWALSYLTRWEQALHLCGGGLGSQTLPLALIGCLDLGAVDSCKSNYRLRIMMTILANMTNVFILMNWYCFWMYLRVHTQNVFTVKLLLLGQHVTLLNFPHSVVELPTRLLIHVIQRDEPFFNSSDAGNSLLRMT